MIDSIRSLLNHKGFMKYFKNTSWLFVEKILRMGVGLFVGVWVARYLGPDQYGLLSYAQSFVGLFAVFATLGLDAIAVRELVKRPDRSEELLGTAFGLKLMGALVVLGMVAVATLFTSNDSYTDTLIFIIASATIFQSFNVVDIYFQSRVLSKYVVFANFISLSLSTIVKIVLILFQAPLIAFAWVVVFDSVVLAMGYLYFYIKKSSISTFGRLRFSKSTALGLLHDSWPLVLSGVVVSVYMKIDQVMIKEMIDSSAVGQYAAAVRLSEAWYFIPMIISSSLFPAIINAKKVSEELYESRLQRLYDLMVWLALLIALPTTFLSDWIVNLLYGEQYHDAGGVLMIHVWAAVFVFLGVASSRWFIVQNYQMLSFWRTFYGMLINIGLNIVWIPKYHIYGAAGATLVSQIVSAYLFDLLHAKTRKMFMMKTRALLLMNVWRKNGD
ncbi:flippase [Hydrogenimonas sp.]